MLESKTVWCVLLTANNSFWNRSVLNSMWLKCTLPYILRDVGNPDQFKTGEGRPKAQKCWCLKRILRNIDVSWHFFLYCLPIALHCVECFMSCYLNKTVFHFWDCIDISWPFFTLPTHLQIFMLIFQKMVDILATPTPRCWSNAKLVMVVRRQAAALMLRSQLDSGLPTPPPSHNWGKSLYSVDKNKDKDNDNGTGYSIIHKII